ncbi:GNAT family N-acetyltransferase [Nocardiopsis halotolerans]|uniref:GNAT family N-acetyltransferase n=1 Tax=Nocardiopsis halotolerans TaxID=124252 RepID=UPI00034DE376|nr:GNAT family N-acetyltransferase [Nocardiopsis halotolerans]
MYRLRRWERSDADRLLEAFAEPELAWQSPEVPDTPEQARDWIDRQRTRAEEGTAFGFAVVDDDGPVLGHVQVAVTSRSHDLGWVSYWTLAEARGRGVATAGTLLASEYAFAEADLFRLELGHRLNNPGSCLVARRAGFRPEGVERRKLRYGGERFDTGSHARLITDPVEGVGPRPCTA